MVELLWDPENQNVQQDGNINNSFYYFNSVTDPKNIRVFLKL